MEYLMTYGWAILIMLVVVAVLFYLGVFNQTSTPKRCTLQAGFTCYDYGLYANESNTQMYLDLGQATGRTINVTGINCTSSSVDLPVPGDITEGILIASGAHVVVANGSSPTDLVICCNGTSGPCKAKFAIRYTNVDSPTIVRTIYGDISGPVETLSGI
ncbi:MAG: hypothetical protein PHF51_05520 [Candidatus ainarchaeum sp.]|nr:hypothetical protein [Candidatus ainarchaeum sp.]